MPILAREETPLLENGGEPTAPFLERLREFFSGEDQPTWAESFGFFFFGTWFNVLLVFVPLSFLSHHLHWDAALRFSFSFFAIVPLAKLLAEATDQLSTKLGQTLAGLLNATFGNAVEIIVGVAALLQGELRIVQTSMLGSILSNLLLVLGCSFLAGGFVVSESSFMQTAAQTSASLMALSCITMVIPAAYHSAQIRKQSPLVVLSDVSDGMFDTHSIESQRGLLFISRGTSILLLLVYVAYLYFQVRVSPVSRGTVPPRHIYG
jgi:Ca2+:H+ antiporter